MRERQRFIINRETGAAAVSTEIAGDADFAQRIRELKASVQLDGPVEARFLGLACNGCAAMATLDFDDPRLPAGWVACDAGDFCPRCQPLN